MARPFVGLKLKKRSKRKYKKWQVNTGTNSMNMFPSLSSLPIPNFFKIRIMYIYRCNSCKYTNVTSKMDSFEDCLAAFLIVYINDSRPQCFCQRPSLVLFIPAVTRQLKTKVGIYIFQNTTIRYYTKYWCTVIRFTLLLWHLTLETLANRNIHFVSGYSNYERHSWTLNANVDWYSTTV